MSKRDDLSARKQAWRDMYQERTCPGDEIFNNPEHAERVEEHKKRCASCAARTSESNRVWKELGETLQAFLPDIAQKEHEAGDDQGNVVELFPAGQKQSTPQAGEIWSLNQNLGHWDTRYRYINPPLVLVVEVLEDIRGVRVAQTFYAPELVYDGDVALDDDFGHAQGWNTYAVRFEDLEQRWGSVGEDSLAAVRNVVENEARVQEPEADTIIHFFRELEMEIAHCMAMQALPVLVHRHEHPGWPDWMADSEQVRGKLQAFVPQAIVPDTDDPLIMLATTKLPQAMLKMAASGTTRQLAYNVISLREPGTPVCGTGLAGIEGQELLGSTIHVEGVIDDEPEKGQLMSWWNLGDDYVEGAVERDPQSGYFEIDFADCTREELDKGTLILLMVEHP